MGEAPERAKSFRDTARDIGRRFSRHENGVLAIVLIVLIAIMAVVSKGLTLSRVNITNTLLQSSMRGVASVGQAFVILTAGIDLSVAGVGLMSAILGTTMMTPKLWQNIVGYSMSPLVVIPIMILAGAGWGVVNGFAVSRMRMPPLIVTLAMWQVSWAVAYFISRGGSIRLKPEQLGFIGMGSIAGVPVPVIIFIVVAVIAYFILNHTIFGQSTYAVGGNPLSAWLSGIKVRRIILSVYVISGVLAGLTGVISAARNVAATMRSLGGLELDTIGAVCVGGVSLAGGKGNMIGVVIGVIIIGVINNAMNVLAAGPAVVAIVKGAVIFTAVAVDYIRRR